VSANGHATPAQIRSRLTHPVIDADGHWLEYGPVFSEQMRKVGGDLAADAFLAALRTTRESLSTSVDERRRRGIGQEGFWTRAERNTRDRATGLFPRFLYERLMPLGYKVADQRLSRGGVPLLWRALYFLADLLLFRALKDRLGLRRLRSGTTGGAALGPEVGNVVHGPAEGVHRVQRVPAGPGKREERVVEVRAAPPREARRQVSDHAIFLASVT